MTIALFDAPPPLLRAIRAELGPQFVNDQQRRFFDCRAPEVLYSGAFRAGKSRIGCEKAYWLMKRYPGIPVGIFRKAARDLESSTQYTMLHDVMPRDEIKKLNKTYRWYELANGSRVTFFGLEADPITRQPSGVGSVELGWAFIDEAVECTEDDWSFVQGRLSWPGIPYHQIAAATNPAAPTHWLKRRFSPPTDSRVYLHASTLDNPALPKDYVENQLGAYTGYRLERYVRGEWVSAEGQIWSLPDDQVRSVPKQPWKRAVAGIDWGYQHPFACEVIAETGLGRKVVVAEHYVRAQTLADIIPSLKALRAAWSIETFFADPSEPAYIEECQRAGLPVALAENDVLPGITAVSQAIAAGLWVSPDCVGLLGEIPGYVWAQDRNGIKDVPLKVNDDACDALRYAVMALRNSIDGPWSLVA